MPVWLKILLALIIAATIWFSLADDGHDDEQDYR